MKPRHIDFLRRTLTVEETIVEVSKKDSPTGQRYIIKPHPKDNEPRTIGVRQTWLDAIAAHIDTRRSDATTCSSPPRSAPPSPGTPSAPASGNPPSPPPASASTSASTTSATPTPPGSSPAAPTSNRSWTAWATPKSKPPRNTSTPSPTPTNATSTPSPAPKDGPGVTPPRKTHAAGRPWVEASGALLHDVDPLERGAARAASDLSAANRSVLDKHAGRP